MKPPAPKAMAGSGLSCRRGGRLLFRDLGFVAASGAALVLTGPNGTGKTSLLRIIAGLLAPESGTITLQGMAAEEDLGASMHFCGPRDGLKAALTPREMLEFWRACTIDPARSARSEDALDRLGVLPLADIPCGYLSSGQRKRVALARLALDPRPIWLLDEPTNALDAASQARLDALAIAHMQDGGMIVVATHVPLAWPGLATLAIDAYRPAGTDIAEDWAA